MGVANTIIFPVAPLGIITAIVGAIRVGGSKAFKTIIGRARESRSAVELELMSSTSTDIGELWDGKGVVRALGAALIVELIHVIPKESKYATNDPETQRICTEESFGIYNFDSAIEFSKTPVLALISTNCDDPSSDRVGVAAPNLSLNFGGKLVTDFELYAVAEFDILVQLAVIGQALLNSVLSPWNQKAAYESAVYTPLMRSGIVALVIRMYLCSNIIERSAVDELWTVQQITQAQVHVACLQRGGVVNDQLFGSYALFATDPNLQNIAVD